MPDGKRRAACVEERHGNKRRERENEGRYGVKKMVNIQKHSKSR
jgi:hypothetical protein